MPPALSRFHASSPHGRGRSCGVAWVAVGGAGESKKRCDDANSMLCQYKAQHLGHCEKDRPLVARGTRRDSAARCNSWCSVCPSTFGLGGRWATLPPRSGCMLWGLFLYSIMVRMVHILRCSEQVSVQYPWKAQPLS